ncbi:MAG: aminoglycoside N(3)-acetyltransferase [Actinomycetota bacterium]
MSEADIVARTLRPLTVDSVAQALLELGVKHGMTLLVHSSLSALGWVAGGAPAVVLGIERAVGANGTVMMPTHSSGLSDPAGWKNPPVPEAWWQTIRDETPAFDALLTPTRAMGAIVDCFRTQPGTIRSSHPQVSFAARGPQAERLTSNHSLDFGLGESSPLGRLYDVDGHVLLLGVGHDNSTSLHLAELRAEFAGFRTVKQGAPVLVAGERRWVEFDEWDYEAASIFGVEEDHLFDVIGADFERDSNGVRRGLVGLAEARLMSQRALVDFGARWMELRAARPTAS